MYYSLGSTYGMAVPQEVGAFEDFLPYGVMRPYYDLGGTSKTSIAGLLLLASAGIGAYLYFTKDERKMRRNIDKFVNKFSTAKQAERWAMKKRDKEPKKETKEARQSRLDEVEAALEAAEYLR